MESKIYVTVGHPARTAPFVSLQEVYAPEGEELEPVKVAKLFRKTVAENAGHYGFRDTQGNVIVFSPAELYWAVYEQTDDEAPTLTSENFPEFITQEIGHEAGLPFNSDNDLLVGFLP